LVDLVLTHFGLQYEWSVDHVRVLPRDEGVTLSCPLFRRLALLGLPTVVVAEYDPYLWTDPPYMKEQNALTDRVLHCATEAGFATVNPFDAIDKGMRTAGRDLYYRKGEHPRLHLKNFAGALQADAYAGFHHLYESGDMYEVACWAHYLERGFIQSVC
jgi:hypothetical protein